MPPKRDLWQISRRHFLRLAAGGVGASVIGLPDSQHIPARASGDKIVVYSALNESVNNAFIDTFKKTTDLNVDLLPLASPGQLQARILAEKDAPRADLFIGGSSEYHMSLGQQGLLLPYRSPNAATIPTDHKDPDGLWTGWYIGVVGLALNKGRFAKEMVGAKKPVSWDELLMPAWKGNLGFPDPAKTSVGYIFIAAQIFRFYQDSLMPPAPATPATPDAPSTPPAVDFSTADYSDAEAQALDYMRKLHNNIAIYGPTLPQTIQLVTNGQCIAAPNWCHDVLTAKSQNLPVELAVPAQSGFEVGAVSIVKGGPNPYGAMAFVDWILTKEAGIMNVKLSNRLSTRPDVPASPGMPARDQITFVAYDRVWATNNRARLLNDWQTIVGF